MVAGMVAGGVAQEGGDVCVHSLKKVMDRGAWWAAVHRIRSEPDTTETT